MAAAPQTGGPQTGEVVDNPALGRFELVENGLLAFADYRRRGAVLILPHVEADPALRGTGAAGRLMAGLAAHARAAGLKILPTCAYAAAWFQRRPDQADLLAD
jgi:predicted GNAT family acetyltransferase